MSAMYLCIGCGSWEGILKSMKERHWTDYTALALFCSLIQQVWMDEHPVALPEQPSSVFSFFLCAVENNFIWNAGHIHFSDATHKL